MIDIVCVHAADTLPLKLFGKSIVYLSSAGSVHYIEPLVSAYIIAVLPVNNGVYNLSVHSDRTIYVLKGRLGQSEQSEP